MVTHKSYTKSAPKPTKMVAAVSAVVVPNQSFCLTENYEINKHKKC